MYHTVAFKVKIETWKTILDQYNCVLDQYNCVLEQYNCVLDQYNCVLDQYNCVFFVVKANSFTKNLKIKLSIERGLCTLHNC